MSLHLVRLRSKGECWQDGVLRLLTQALLCGSRERAEVPDFTCKNHQKPCKRGGFVAPRYCQGRRPLLLAQIPMDLAAGDDTLASQEVRQAGGTCKTLESRPGEPLRRFET